MAHVGSLKRALGIGALGCALACVGCGTREVYLVPPGSAEDASVGPLTDGPVLHPTDARTTDVGPPLHPQGRDAGDSGPRCETNRYAEVPEPLGVYLMVDQSNSMDDRWSSVVTALGAFITDSGALTDVSMGIQYFAVSPTSPTQPFVEWHNLACSAAAYEIPDVAISPLPGNQDALVQSLARHDPSNRMQPLPLGILESPTDLALAGAIAGVRAWSVGKRNPRLAVLLVTDGVPGIECNAATLEGTVQAAAEGVAGSPSGSPSVVTYVLGVRDNLDPLNRIASAGGTGQAYLTTAAAPGDILAQLDSIREVALPCEISVEKAHLVQGDVNVELKAADGSEILSRVESRSDCAAPGSTLRWYAAEPDASENIALCPAACSAVRTKKNATLDVVYGCPTVVMK